MPEFSDRVFNVIDRPVSPLLHNPLGNIWAPSDCQLLNGANVKISIVQMGLKFWHIFHQEATVLANGITAQWRDAFVYPDAMKASVFASASASVMPSVLTRSTKPDAV